MYDAVNLVLLIVVAMLRKKASTKIFDTSALATVVNVALATIATSNMQVGSPFERVGIDLIGPWPSSNGRVYIMTYIDHFTKWADAIPIAKREATTVSNALVSTIFVHVGVPLQMLSDQGREFDNRLISSLCQLLGIDKVRTTPYHAATNGAIERMHRSINSLLAKCVDDNQRN